jgi:serine/threonine protein kinase
MVGQSLAHYRILEKIGSGGMGDVYLAEDTKLDRKVALKILPPDLAENENRRTRFAHEAKALAALNHPNIVTVYSVEKAASVHFITMELVRGKSLADIRRRIWCRAGRPMAKRSRSTREGPGKMPSGSWKPKEASRVTLHPRLSPNGHPTDAGL